MSKGKSAADRWRLIEAPSRRDFVTGLMAAALAPPAIVSATTNGGIPVEQFGSIGTGDDYQTLQKALDFCSRSRRPLILGPRIYTHSRDLVINSTMVAGISGRTEIRRLQQQNASIIIRGDNASFSNCRIAGTPVNTRLSGADGIRVDRASNFAIDGCSINDLAGTGIIIRGSQNGRISGNTIQRTGADGLHITAGSSSIFLEGIETSETGDDGIAVVSYHKDGASCHSIQIRSCRSNRSNARGMAIVGGYGISIAGSQVISSRAAGYYLFGEISYDTYGVADCEITNSSALSCVTDPRVGHAAVMFGGRDQAETLPTGARWLGASHCTARNVTVHGLGPGARQAFSLRAGSRDCQVDHCTVDYVGDISLSKQKAFDDQGERNRMLGNTVRQMT